MTTVEEPPQLPFARANVLEIAPLHAALRGKEPISRVRTPAGDLAWLVNRFEEARTLFADQRLGRSHPQPERAARVSDAAIVNGPSSSYDTERAEHTRMRRLLTPAFSARRMRLLTDHIHELVEERMNAMQAARDAAPEQPVDLHEHLSFPLPVRVICGLLGVPFADREYFHDLSDRMNRMGTGDGAQAAREEFNRYMSGLAAQKRVEPGEDVVSDLVAAQAEDPEFTEEELSRLAAGLLFAGHETTVNQIDLGVLMLLSDEERRDAFAADPDGQVQRTVEEMLRLSSPGALGLLRYAHEDLEIGGVTIARGDAVLIPTGVVNRDPAAFDEPEEFNPSRSETAHLAFGHGPHFCIGASLARTELKVVFAALFKRFPKLRLAAEVGELEMRLDRVTGGVQRVPVTW